MQRVRKPQWSQNHSPILMAARLPRLPSDQQHKADQHRPQWAKRQRAGVHDWSLSLRDRAVKRSAEPSRFWLERRGGYQSTGEATGRDSVQLGGRWGARTFVNE
jgi:hypothetical protein